MKRKKEALCLILTVFVAWLPFLMAAWDKDKPAATTTLATSNPQILANFAALETALTADHEFSTGGTNSGEHQRVKFNAPLAQPTSAANKGYLYMSDISAVGELFWLDESGNNVQMTSGGDMYSSGGLSVASAFAVTGESTFNNHINLGAGDDLLGSSTSDITFNTNKFTVAGATGNTVVAGTLGVTGVLTTTAATVLGDGSVLAAATALTDGDRTIVDKAWVETTRGMGSSTTDDADSAALNKDVTYTAPTDGLVMVYTSLTNNVTCHIKVDGTYVVRSNPISNSSRASGTVGVPSGSTFLVESNGTVTVTWQPFGTLRAPTK